MTAPPDSQAPAAPPARRSRRRWVAAAGIALVVVLLGVRAWLPQWLEQTIEREASVALGREVRVSDVNLALLAGQLEIEGLTIGGPLGGGLEEEPRIELERLELTLDPNALFSREVHLTRLAGAGLSVRLERNAAGEIEPLVLATPSPEPVAEPEGPAWAVRLEDLQLEDATLHIVRAGETARREIDFSLELLALGELAFRDERVTVGDIAFRGPRLAVRRSVGEPDPDPAAEPAPPPVSTAPAPSDTNPTSPLGEHRIDTLAVEGAEFTLLWEDAEPLAASLDFAARDISAQTGFPVSLSVTLEGAELGIEGTLAIAPLAFEGALHWSQLRLPRLLAASGVEIDGTLAAGRTNGRLDVALAVSGPTPAVTLAGEAQVVGLDGVIRGNHLTLPSIDANIEEIRVPLSADETTPLIHLSSLTLEQPHAVLLRAPTPESAAESAAAAAGEPGSEPLIRIDALAIEDGTLEFADRTLRSPFETRWREVDVAGQGIRWPEQDGVFTLRARGPGGASLRIDGTLADGNGQIASKLDRLSLAPLDPFADAHTGLRLEGGRVTLSSKVGLGSVTRTQSVLTLQRAEASERESGWFQQVFGVPLDLALALLRDLEGNITLPVDADFGPEDSSVGLLAIVAATLKHAVIGAVASPLKLLGGVADVASDALAGGAIAPLAVEAGAEALAPEAEARLESLASTLAEKPGLRLVLRGGADASDDPTLARRMVIERARAGDLPDASELGFFERRRVGQALATLAPDADPVGPDPESEAALALLASRLEVPSARREALARRRAVRVRRQLLEDYEIPAEAVAIDEGTAAAAGVAIELSPRPPTEEAGS